MGTHTSILDIMAKIKGKKKEKDVKQKDVKTVSPEIFKLEKTDVAEISENRKSAISQNGKKPINMNKYKNRGTVFISRLPKHFLEEEMWTYFCQFGKVYRV